MRPAVFLERDGILNHYQASRQLLMSPACAQEFRIHEASVGPIRQLKSAGFLLICITNQPGLSRGSLSRSDLDLMHAQLMRRFPLEGILVCPHDDLERCPCRKPRPGLIYEAAFRWQLDLERSFVISDKWQDAAAAHNSGCTSLLIQSPWSGNGHHDFLLPDLPSAVQKLLRFYSAPYSPAVA